MPPIKIIVAGTLEFVNGYKLGLPCGSQVEILVGGLLKKATAGGGNSTLIDICGSTVWNAGDGPIAGYALLQAGGSLPVSWLYLNASRKENFVQVGWSTASEVNNDFFTVERSTDQFHFTSISKVDGAGNSSFLNNYSFQDLDAPSGLVYYRIRQTDFDGRNSFSKLVAVSGRNTKNFELIAVVSHEGSNINIVFSEPLMPHCNFKICDVGGRVIDMGVIEAGEGIISRNISAPALVRGGIYLLQLSNGVDVVAKRFIVN